MDNIQYTAKEGNRVVVPVYNGRTIDTMPRLISQGYTPISLAQIMEQRVLEWESENQKLAQIWGNNYFDSGDSIIYHPDGRIKIVHDSKSLQSVNSATQLRWNGSLVLPEGTFENTEGQEFSREDVDKFTGKYLKQKEVLENPIWQAFARGNKELLKTYIEQVCSRIKHPSVMQINVSNEKPDFEAERLWHFDGIDFDRYVGGDYYQYGGLDYKFGRLVGIPQKLEDKLN